VSGATSPHVDGSDRDEVRKRRVAQRPVSRISDGAVDVAGAVVQQLTLGGL
jgi:hypothetical protein